MTKKRPDSERRTRQADRLAKLLRLLKMIMGPGRWDADSLATELECSTRTVHRLLKCLELAGVPWQFDHKHQAYKVPSGFRFPGLDEVKSVIPPVRTEPKVPKNQLKQVLAQGEKLIQMLQQFIGSLKEEK